MTTDELIGRLTREAAPVRPLAPLRVRFARWSLAALAISTAGMMAIGPRGDVLDVLQTPGFLATTGLLIATAGLAAAAALVLSVPGAERSRLQRAVPVVAAGVWPVTLAAGLARSADLGDLDAFALHGACGPLIAALAIGPGWLLFRMVRAGATLAPAWSAALAALAASALAAAAMQIACTIDAPGHHLIEHVLPVAILCAAAATAGGRWLETPAIS